MNTEYHQIMVSGLPVKVIRKSIKNLHLGVYPPNGRVRVAAPLALNDEAVRLAVIGKLGWIKRQQERFKVQTRQSEREMINGESHYFLGQRHRLLVVKHDGIAKVMIRNKSAIELWVGSKTSVERRNRVIQHWYREQLKQLIPPILKKWQTVLNVHPTAWGIKKMKTRWGTCNVDARRIWLNLELIKKSVQCLEYIVVHELVHLIERHHNDRFIAIMDQHLPQWRLHRHELSSAPLAHETWNY